MEKQVQLKIINNAKEKLKKLIEKLSKYNSQNITRHKSLTETILKKSSSNKSKFYIGDEDNFSIEDKHKNLSEKLINLIKQINSHKVSDYNQTPYKLVILKKAIFNLTKLLKENNASKKFNNKLNYFFVEFISLLLKKEKAIEYFLLVNNEKRKIKNFNEYKFEIIHLLKYIDYQKELLVKPVKKRSNIRTRTMQAKVIIFTPVNSKPNSPSHKLEIIKNNPIESTKFLINQIENKLNAHSQTTKIFSQNADINSEREREIMQELLELNESTKPKTVKEDSTAIDKINYNMDFLSSDNLKTKRHTLVSINNNKYNFDDNKSFSRQSRYSSNSDSPNSSSSNNFYISKNGSNFSNNESVSGQNNKIIIHANNDKEITIHDNNDNGGCEIDNLVQLVDFEQMIADENLQDEITHIKMNNVYKHISSEEVLPEIYISDFITIIPIGKGGYGKVDLVKKKSTGEMFALKTVEIKFLVNLLYYI